MTGDADRDSGEVELGLNTEFAGMNAGFGATIGGDWGSRASVGGKLRITLPF